MVNTVSQIIKGSGTYPADVSTFDVTISPALSDITKAVVFVSFATSDINDHAFTFRSWEIIDSTTLRLFGRGDLATGNNSLPFEYTIIEFTSDSDVVVEHSTLSVAGGATEGEQTQTITAVTPAETSLFHNGQNHNNADTTIGNEEYARVRLVDSTNWGWLVIDTPNNGPTQIRSSIADWNDSNVTVQRGLATLAVNTGSITIIPSTAVDRTRSILRVTASPATSVGFSIDPDEVMVTATLNASNQIVVTRLDSTAVPALNIAWEITEFPANDLISVEYGAISQGIGVANTTTSITAVNTLANSTVFSPVSIPFGTGCGNTDEDTPGDIGTGMWELLFDDASTVRATRQSTGDTGNIEFMAIQWKVRQEEIFTVDAFIQTEQLFNFTVDALLSDEIMKFFLIDALPQTTFTKDFTVNAIFRGVTIAVDGILLKVPQKLFDVDAILKGTIDETFTIDAFVQALDQLFNFTADAQLESANTKLFTTDAIIKALDLEEDFTIDARALLVQTETFTIDAKLPFTFDFTIDAILPQTEKFTCDAILKATFNKNFTVDAVLFIFPSKLINIDALLQKQNINSNFTIDAILNAIQTITFTVDTFSTAEGQQKTFSIDVRLRIIVPEVFTADAFLLKTQIKSFTIDTFSEEEFIKSFTVDAFIQELGKTSIFTVDTFSELQKVINFTVDALIKNIFIETFDIDGILFIFPSNLITIDALLQVQNITKDFTVDAFLQREEIRPFQIDAIVTGGQTETFTVDAQIFLPSFETFEVDALTLGTQTFDFTVDAKVQAPFINEFIVDGITFVIPSQLITVDGLTLGTQTKDFTVDADLRNVKTTTFDVDAVIKLTGDVLCAGSDVIFSDSIPNDTGWTVNFTFPSQQVFVDDVLFPGVIRLECFNSRLYTDNQAIKQFTTQPIQSKQDLEWEFEHRHLQTCSGFLANYVFALTETTTITNDISQGAIIFRELSVGSTAQVRAEIRDSSGAVASTNQFTVSGGGPVDITFYDRISIISGGTDLKLEIFSDSARTNLLFTDTVSIAGVNSEFLQYIQVSPIGGGSPARRAREEFDDILIRLNRCPRFDVNAVVKGAIEKNFIVDANLTRRELFTVDGLLRGVNSKLFLIDAFIGIPEINFTIDAVLIKASTFEVDVLIKAVNQKVDFEVDAQITVPNTEKTFTVDARIARLENFTVDAVIKKPGDVLCSQISNIFEDDISTDAGWTVTGTQILVDDPSFPGVIRGECVVNSTTVVQQAVKPLDVSMLNTRDMVWDIDYTAFNPCISGNNNLYIALTETDDRVDDIGQEAYIRLRIFKSFSNKFQVNVVSHDGDISTVGTTSFLSSTPKPKTFFLRVSILNAGTNLRLEVFNDSDRTVLLFTDTVDQSSLANAKLNFIQVSNLGGQAQVTNQLRGEVDNFLIIGDGCPRFDIDTLVQATDQEEIFTVDAKLIRFPKTFTVDAIILTGQGELFRVDGITFVVPARLFTVDAILQPFINFTVDAVLFQATQTFDFTIDAFIQRTGEQLCSQDTSFPNFTEDFSSYVDQTEADTAWVPADIASSQVDITNDWLGVIQVNDSSNDANVFDLETALGEPIDGQFWTLRYKLVINSVTNTLSPVVFNEGFFGITDSTGDSQTSQTSIGLNIRTSTISASQFRANRSLASGIYPMNTGGDYTVQQPVAGTYYVEIKRTGFLNSETRIFSDANYSNLLDQANFSLGIGVGNMRYLAYKNRSDTSVSPGQTDYTIDDIQFWNGTADVSSECPKFEVDAVIQTPTIDKEFDVDAVILLPGENGICNFFPGTNLAVDTGLEQFIGPVQPVHENLVEQLVGQEVTLSNQQVRSVSFLLRSSNFPNEITTNMPIDAQIWSGVVVGNNGGETIEAVSTTVIDAINTSGDLPPGDWTLVKFEFDIVTTPFLTGDFVVGYKSLSSVDDPAGVGSAIPVVSNSNVIPGSAVHRKGANSTLGDTDEWGYLTNFAKDMIIQLEVVNGDEIVLGEGKQCPVVDAVLRNNPAEPLIDAVLVDRPQVDFIIDGLIAPFPVPFEVDGILVGTQLPFTVDAQLIGEIKFSVDGLIIDDGQKLFSVDALIRGANFDIDGFLQITKNAPLFNCNALLFKERTKDFTVDGTTKFFNVVAPFDVDAQVIFFPSQLPQVDGIIKALGTPKDFTVDALIQRLDFNFIRTIDALILKETDGDFLIDGLLETSDIDETFLVDARLSTPDTILFTVDANTNLQNGRWQTDALLSKKVDKLFLVDTLLVVNPQKLFLVDASTLGTVDEEFTVDGLIQSVDNEEDFGVDARILQINIVDFTVDARLKNFGVEFDFTVDAKIVRIEEFLVDMFVKALGDGVLGTGNNGSTNANNTTNPYVSQTTDDNTVTLPIGTLVGQRLRLPTAPVRVTDYTFVIHRAGTAGTPMGTLTGKIYKNSIGGNSILGADLIATSDNVVTLASITTSSSGQNIQFTFTNPPEITVDDNVFIGFDIAGSNEQMFLHTESTGTVIDGGDVNIESTGTWGADLGVDAVLTVNIDTEQRQRASALMDAFVGVFEKEIIGVDALIKSIGGVSPTPGPAEFTVDAKVAFVKVEGFDVDAILIGSQDFMVSAFVGDTLFTGLTVESVIVQNNSIEGVESVIVENNSTEGVESVIGQDT